MSLVGVGGAFFAHWVVAYGFGAFGIATPNLEDSWVALLVVAMVWGLVYAGIARLEEDEWKNFMLETYDDIFLPNNKWEFVRGVLSALPINILFSWFLANGIGVSVAHLFAADLVRVVHLIFGLTNGIGILWFSVSRTKFYRETYRDVRLNWARFWPDP